jgi:hypothetical protein
VWLRIPHVRRSSPLTKKKIQDERLVESLTTPTFVGICQALAKNNALNSIVLGKSLKNNDMANMRMHSLKENCVYEEIIIPVWYP